MNVRDVLQGMLADQVRKNGSAIEEPHLASLTFSCFFEAEVFAAANGFHLAKGQNGELVFTDNCNPTAIVKTTHCDGQ